MRMLRAGTLVLAVVLAGCAQVPKESVELSTTVGRDVTVAHKAHRELARVLFTRMKQDVNRFVDTVYAPHQIRTAMERDAERSRSTDASVRSGSLLLGINRAFADGATPTQQAAALTGMSYLVQAIRDDVESMRAELLKPVLDQEEQVLSAIDRNYAQIIYGNSVVTGHLASIVKVRDAQNEVLQAIGAPADFQDTLGKKLAAASEKVAGFVEKAGNSNRKLDDLVKELKEKLAGK